MALINEHTQGSNVRGNYKKYTDEDRYKIGKYASENGSAATVRKFKSDFPKLNESTVRDFKRKYEEKLKISKKKGENVSPLVTEKRGRPLLLDKLDELVQIGTEIYQSCIEPWSCYIRKKLTRGANSEVGENGRLWRVMFSILF